MSGVFPTRAAAVGRTMATTTTHKEDSVALIQVKLIEGIFTAQQKQTIVERLTDAMVEIEGESMRRTTWCMIEEVASGEWGIGGRILTADDIKALARAGD
jgi:4-oxalocrotonate tautomerase